MCWRPGIDQAGTQLLAVTERTITREGIAGEGVSLSQCVWKNTLGLSVVSYSRYVFEFKKEDIIYG